MINEEMVSSNVVNYTHDTRMVNMSVMVDND